MEKELTTLLGRYTAPIHLTSLPASLKTKFQYHSDSVQIKHPTALIKSLKRLKKYYKSRAHCIGIAIQGLEEEKIESSGELFVMMVDSKHVQQEEKLEAKLKKT